MLKDIAKDKFLQAAAGGRSLEEQWDWIRKEKIQSKPIDLRNKLLWSLGIEEPKEKAETVVLLGCYPLFRRPLSVRNYFMLLNRLGIDFTYLPEEMCCGLAPLEIAKGEDRKRAERASSEFLGSNLEMVKKAGAKNAVYLCVWCAHMLKNFHAQSSPIALMHYPDILLDRLSKERLRVEPKVVGYYEGCHRRNKQWAPGVTLEWDKYREVLNNIEGLKVVKMPDNVCCIDSPERIIDAAQDLNLDTVVCSCLTCDIRLRDVSRGRVRLQYYSDLLLEALG